MIRIMGHDVQETTEVDCRRGLGKKEHVELKQAAHASRQKAGFDVNSSYVLCTRCGMLISLKC